MQDLTFEEAFENLKKVVDELEGGDLSLDQSLALFEQGKQLAELCQHRLNEAELRVSQILSEGESQLGVAPLDVHLAEPGE
jgi:exodeoxyribonuclease VII small subunit